jgi:hypothetical protein
MVSEKINAALKSTNSENTQFLEATVEEKAELVADPEEIIVTTEEEIEGYSMVKIMLQDVVEFKRVHYRDNLRYFNILLDDNIRKWVVRLWLNGSQKYIQFNDEDKSKVGIENITDILTYRERINAVASKF